MNQEIQLYQTNRFLKDEIKIIVIKLKNINDIKSKLIFYFIKNKLVLCIHYKHTIKYFICIIKTW
jgi:hypothetical protein